MPYENSGNKIKTIRINKNNVRITFYNGKSLLISKDDYISSYFYKDKVLTNEEVNKLKTSLNNVKLYNYCVRILSKHRYSEFQIREKLYIKEVKKVEVDSIINKLKQNKFIDDDVLVDDYFTYLSSLNYGKTKIINTLINKGINKDRLNKLIFNDEEEFNKAIYWINKCEDKCNQLNNAKKLAYLRRYLVNKGFDYQVIENSLKRVKPNSFSMESSFLKKDYKKIKERLIKKYQGKELKQKILTSLINKGYKINEIIKVME